MRLKKRQRKRTAGIASLLGILLSSFLSGSCKSPNSSNERLTTQVTVYNTCGAAVDVSMDGNLQVSIAIDSIEIIRNVVKGSHLFEAKTTGTGIAVYSVTIDVVTNQLYSLVIEGPGKINVVNQYGETLKIYGDDTYLFDLDNAATKAITGVTFGTHAFKATKKSDGTTAASTSFSIVDAREYAWTIIK